jgi:hypothetical protein
MPQPRDANEEGRSPHIRRHNRDIRSPKGASTVTKISKDETQQGHRDCDIRHTTLGSAESISLKKQGDIE